MKYTRDETGYILKHEDGKYFIMPAPGMSYEHMSCSLSDYFTKDPLKATRFSMREVAEMVIERNKNIDRSNIRWNSERALVEIISACTVKELRVYDEYEVEE